MTCAVQLQRERQNWGNLEESIVSAGGIEEDTDLFINLEVACYDGLDVTVRSKAKVVFPELAAICNSAVDADLDLPGQQQKDIGSSKILQSELCPGIGFFKRGMCHIVVGSQLTTLQRSDRTTGVCMGEMLKNQCMGVTGHSSFPRRLRNICTDRCVPT